MTGKELLYIKTIAEEKSISRAAKKLYIAQPSLSQSLQRVEKTLGTELFIRTSLGLRLTLAGEQYYKSANQILRIYEDMEMSIADINSLKMGRINLGITSHLGRILLPGAIADFKKLYPNIEINILEDSSGELEKRMISGQIDFAIMHIRADEELVHLDSETVQNENFIIVASNKSNIVKYAYEDKKYAYPLIDIKKLKDDEFISLTKSQKIRQMNDFILKNAGISDLDIKLSLKNYLTMLDLVNENIGITLFPEEYMEFYKKTNMHYSNLSYFSIHEKYKPFWKLCIAYPKDGFLSKADLLFLDLLKKRL